LIDHLVAGAKKFPKIVTPPCKKGSRAVRKMDKTLTGILKRQPNDDRTATGLQTSMAELQVVFQRTI
jgi:hypothetical protein